MPSKKHNPFDFSEYFLQIDPTSLLDEWQKMFTKAALPQVDTRALLETQSKNLYALVAANQSVMAGAPQFPQRPGGHNQKAHSQGYHGKQGMGKINKTNQAGGKKARNM